MHKLTFAYSSILLSWIRDLFSNPEFERLTFCRITTHKYCDHESVLTMRQINDVYLVNFFQLTLKSTDDFAAAFYTMTSTKLSDYIFKHCRQIVYESLLKFCEPSNVPDNTASFHLHVDHFYTTVGSSGPGTHNPSIHIRNDQPRVLSIIPCFGPLHISLNGRKTVFHNYCPFLLIVTYNSFHCAIITPVL